MNIDAGARLDWPPGLLLVLYLLGAILTHGIVDAFNRIDRIVAGHSAERVLLPQLLYLQLFIFKLLILATTQG